MHQTLDEYEKNAIYSMKMSQWDKRKLIILSQAAKKRRQKNESWVNGQGMHLNLIKFKCGIKSLANYLFYAAAKYVIHIPIQLHCATQYTMHTLIVCCKSSLAVNRLER